MSFRRAFLITVLLVASFGVGSLNATLPVSVSPGEIETAAEISGRCPTFSWSVVEGADGYEIVVYEIDEASFQSDPEAEQSLTPALEIGIPGAALTWTPPAKRCLARGKQYAWLVRAVRGEDAGQWSAPRLFSVPAKPSQEDVQDALEVLRSYLGESPAPEESAIAEFQQILATTPSQVEAAGSGEPGTNAPPPTETWGIDSVVEGPLIGYGIRGRTLSDTDGSIGVVGEATSTIGSTFGVSGENYSQGGGVRGISWGTTGDTSGVFGFAASPNGYAGRFSTFFSGTGGVYAQAATNDYADLVLGGTSSSQDDGTIRSDPDYDGSDIFIDANDAVVVRLNYDNAGSDTDNDFWVQNGAGTNLFNVDESGQVTISGNLTVNGSVGGTLVDQNDINAALLAHENQYHPLRVFVTSTTYTGNLGGLGGGDTKCQARASAAGLAGTFKAWLSGNETNEEARDRLNQTTRPYYLPSGQKVADNWSDLTDGSLDHAINYNEFGNQVTTTTTAYTNTTSGGGRVGNTRDCGPSATEWTSSSQFESGAYGLITSTSSSWSFSTNNACNNSRRLYCFQQ